MESQRQLTGVFATLKQVLKAQGIHYRALADQLGVSEPTIKRMFQEEDCKLSRLAEICEAVGLSVTELLALHERQHLQVSQLPLDTEHTLAQHPSLFAFFILLLSQFTPDKIAALNGLSRVDLYRYLRELEKLGLIRIGKEQQVHLCVAKPLRWRLDGPLHPVLVEINQRFIADVIDVHSTQAVPFYSASRLLSKASAERLGQAVDALYEDFHKQAMLDQLYYTEEQLMPYKMVLAQAPFAVAEYFKVEAFGQ